MMRNQIRSLFLGRPSLVLLAAMLFSSPAVHAQAQIIRDSTPGQFPVVISPNPSIIHVIDGDQGVRRDNGALVLHSFDTFNLGAGDAALFTDTPQNLASVEIVLIRITGVSSSQLYGRIQSDYLNAELLFVNSNGIFFGQNFAIDERQGSHFSTADQLELRDSSSGSVVLIDMSISTPIPVLDPSADFTPFAWIFLGPTPTTITVEGFTAFDPGIISPNTEFSFVGGDVLLGAAVAPIDISTNGRSLSVVALGRDGRVEGFADDSGGGAFSVEVTDLAGNPVLPEGQVLLRGDVHTSGASAFNGDVLFWGGNLDLSGNSIITGGNLSAAQKAGDVFLFGNDILIDMAIDTLSVFNNAGDVEIFGANSVWFSATSSIRTSASAPGTQSGNVSINSNYITADGIQIIINGEGQGLSDGGALRISGDTISLVGAGIRGETENLASIAVISSRLVDMTGASILFSNFGGNGMGGSIVLFGADELNVTNVVGDVRNEGLGGNGGDIILQTANLIGEQTADFDVAALTGVDGTVTIIFLGGFLVLDIDIKPHNDLNPVAPASRGLTPVAILSSDTFDVTNLDLTTLAFGPDGAAPVFDLTNRWVFFFSHRDVNHDGKRDLVSFYKTSKTGIEFGDTEACVTGELLDGTPFEGCDEIVTVPGCGLGFELVFLLPPLMWAHGRRRRTTH